MTTTDTRPVTGPDGDNPITRHTVDFGDSRLPDRFWDKCTPVPFSGCWLWYAAVNEFGYARFTFRARVWYGHRLTYETLLDPVRRDLVLDHRCRVTSCVNPLHVEAVTAAVNTLRQGRQERTHCPKGHPFDEVNTYIPVNGRGRKCRACHAIGVSNRKRLLNSAALVDATRVVSSAIVASGLLVVGQIEPGLTTDDGSVEVRLSIRVPASAVENARQGGSK
jgi:hypothetical protein